MPVRRSPRRPLLLALPLLLAGCATINATVDPWAREAGVRAGAPVILFGKVGQVRIFREGQAEPLKVVIVENPSFKTALGNAIRQSAAEARAGASPTGTASYTRNMEYAPAVYLKQKQIHRLRVVHPDGREAVVVARPHVAAKYLVVDWLLVAPSFFTSILIDWGTGKWQVFDPIDVDALFARADDAAGTAAPAAPAPEATVPEETPQAP